MTKLEKELQPHLVLAHALLECAQAKGFSKQSKENAKVHCVWRVRRASRGAINRVLYAIHDVVYCFLWSSFYEPNILIIRGEAIYSGRWCIISMKGSVWKTRFIRAAGNDTPTLV